MGLLHLAAAAVGCVIIQQPGIGCTETAVSNPAALASRPPDVPVLTGPAMDVVLTAESAFAWDLNTGEVLYEKNADDERPVASLNKLLTALTARAELDPNREVEIPPEARRPQLMGANVKLPIGEHVTVRELLGASLIASGNDAAVSLAVAVAGSEEDFVAVANKHAGELGLSHTRLSNATGFSGGVQHSTAREISQMLAMAYRDDVLGQFLSQPAGELVTREGSRRVYKTTNRLLGSYLPVAAAKTGYTIEAGENLALISSGDDGQLVGAVVLGSRQRFQDTKVLFEWMWRNWSWPLEESGYGV